LSLDQPYYRLCTRDFPLRMVELKLPEPQFLVGFRQGALRHNFAFVDGA
jgi:hypothetical protein